MLLSTILYTAIQTVQNMFTRHCLSVSRPEAIKMNNQLAQQPLCHLLHQMADNKTQYKLLKTHVTGLSDTRLCILSDKMHVATHM